MTLVGELLLSDYATIIPLPRSTQHMLEDLKGYEGPIVTQSYQMQEKLNVTLI